MHDISDIKIIIKPIAIQYELKRVFLFGSYAKCNATPNSDIDLLIEKGKITKNGAVCHKQLRFHLL